MILYVEDEPDDAFFMARAFKQVAGAPPLRVLVDGELAVGYLEGRPPYSDRAEHPLPRVLLLDLNLPRRSGFEVLEWIRRQPHLQQLPVVVFSSSGRTDDRDRATALGVRRYIQKPTSGLGFVQVARELCGLVA
ncbi:response regulator [Opitutus sp. ER46]|uniref:response regulator n=1 Tax=Opitutus sp. ER46 TaxID=2161864 RepID=UPI000D31FE68|nr:response regulator [Opitutus sp. ER46]PTX96510.1 two-component system response regulator [Opitutus sp. ER46]